MRFIVRGVCVASGCFIQRRICTVLGGLLRYHSRLLPPSRALFLRSNFRNTTRRRTNKSRSVETQHVSRGICRLHTRSMPLETLICASLDLYYRKPLVVICIYSWFDRRLGHLSIGIVSFALKFRVKKKRQHSRGAKNSLCQSCSVAWGLCFEDRDADVYSIVIVGIAMSLFVTVSWCYQQYFIRAVGYGGRVMAALRN